MEQKITDIIQPLLQFLHVDDALLKVHIKDNRCVISIETFFERTLIGRDGERFDSFEHIIKKLVASVAPDLLKVSVDVNNQKSKQDEVLKAKVLLLAKRAQDLKMSVELDPMSSYDRMLVHSFLEGQPNIKTESIGEGKDRKVVIVYQKNDKEKKEEF
jgi:spoIIIJ-associated protein